jgi:hypothetical protein
MGHKVSNAELRRQIKREGMRWGLVPMTSIFGHVLVAEEIPCVVPLSGNVMIIDRVQRDITGISQDYPFSALLRNRKHKAERTASLRAEITNQLEEAAIKKRLAEIYAELKSDIKRADKQRVVKYGNVAVRS